MDDAVLDDERDKAAAREPHDWQLLVATRAALAAGVPTELLDEYLQILSGAALRRERPQAEQLAALRRLGRRAAEEGLGADRTVDLYLSAAWRLWEAIPPAPGQDTDDVRRAAGTVMQVVNQSVEVLVDGHQAARREMIRHEESIRREFIDDLLRGDANVSRLVQRAQPFGLDLSRPHQVLLAEQLAYSPADLDRAAGPAERAVVDRYGDREMLVATKDALLVVVVPGGTSEGGASGAKRQEVADFVRSHLVRHTGKRTWQVAVGRSYAGAYGVATSYEEAREVLGLARQLGLDASTVRPLDLLLYRVLGRDQAALSDLVVALLQPLTAARGGAQPLLATLEAYFQSGGVATQTARQLHMSVRTVTYRLEKIAALTGADPTDPAESLALHVAVLGARLLDSPSRETTV